MGIKYPVGGNRAYLGINIDAMMGESFIVTQIPCIQAGDCLSLKWYPDWQYISAYSILLALARCDLPDIIDPVSSNLYSDPFPTCPAR